MGFSLEAFFEQLQYMVENCASHIEILQFIKDEKQYAQDCGLLND